jgi:cytochrome subunit of sulfide dehydrogenase
MRMIRQSTSAALAIGLVSSFMAGTTALAQDSQAQRVYNMSLAATCANCHGTNGVSVAGNRIPKIDELTHAQIAEALRQYKSGIKSGTIMPQISRGYTEDQIDIIASVLGKPSK